MRSRILFFLPLLLTFSGCCREQDLRLAPALAGWIPYYGQQEVSFVNAGGQKLTFVAGLSRFNQEGSDQVCGAYDIETLQLQLSSVSDPAFRVQVSLSHEILVGIKVLRQDPAGLGLDILYNTLSEHYISDAWRDRYFPEISLNGRTYHNVLHAYGIPTAGPLSFAEMYYGKETGLIGFRLFPGDWYFLE